MRSLGPQPPPRLLVPRLDLSLADIERTSNGEMVGFASVTGGILANNTVHVFRGDIETAEIRDWNKTRDVTLVLELGDDPNRGMVRIIVPFGDLKIGLSMPLLKGHIEFAVVRAANSAEQDIDFNSALDDLNDVFKR